MTSERSSRRRLPSPVAVVAEPRRRALKATSTRMIPNCSSRTGRCSATARGMAASGPCGGDSNRPDGAAAAAGRDTVARFELHDAQRRIAKVGSRFDLALGQFLSVGRRRKGSSRKLVGSASGARRSLVAKEVPESLRTGPKQRREGPCEARRASGRRRMPLRGWQKPRARLRGVKALEALAA